MSSNGTELYVHYVKRSDAKPFTFSDDARVVEVPDGKNDPQRAAAGAQDGEVYFMFEERTEQKKSQPKITFSNYHKVADYLR